MAFSTFYNNFTCKNVLITKSVQKHTDNKFFAAFEPEIYTHLQGGSRNIVIKTDDFPFKKQCQKKEKNVSFAKE